MLENNEDLAYVVPEEGSNWFVDAMCVLKTSQHKEEAEAWINFMASTEANLRNMDYIWYASPNAEALETYPAYYEETYGEPLDPALYEIMAPSQEVLDRCEAYLVLPAAAPEHSPVPLLFPLRIPLLSCTLERRKIFYQGGILS